MSHWREKIEGNKNDDFEELIEKQKLVDVAISANSAAILKIDQEIQVLSDNAITKTEATADSQDNTVNKDGTVTVDNGSVKSDKICRHHNKGYCRYKRRCRYSHSKEV